MDSGEMKSLEEKTRAIVGSLSKLEGEAKRQKEMGDRLEESRQALLELASALRGATDGLDDVIALLQRGTFAEDVSRLEEKIEAVREAGELVAGDLEKAEQLCKDTAELVIGVEASIKEMGSCVDRIEVKCDELIEGVRTIGEASSQRDGRIAKKLEAIGYANDERGGEISRRLQTLEEIIGRIDRNTQKGFGKERG